MKIIINSELPTACHYVHVVLKEHFTKRAEITHNSVVLFKDDVLVINRITKLGFSFKVLKK